ncbi:MAG: PIN domain-containing protein [Deltaproteobacteria bacterium]|jgi:predicted nucleic acid-binding protein|nr:PIN domain-containing protein [Deltaproteobacteria bacterium]
MKIYLETTIFNYYFDVERDAHPATIQLFNEIKAGKFEPYTSVVVVRELEKAKKEKRDKMLSLIAKFNITVLPENDDAVNLAYLYIKNNVITLNHLIDATHIAIATVNNLDKIISLNFSHIVRDKTRLFTEYINSINGYGSIDINSPMEIVDHEDY